MFSTIRHAMFAVHVLAAMVCLAGAGGDGKKGADKGQPAWKALFDGKSLAGWKEVDFGGEGEVRVEGGAIIMEQGNDMTGIRYTGKDFPQTNYEISLEGKRIKGSDFFCTTTFPFGKDHCSLVVGGWGGTVVGISSINGADASENETRSMQQFKADRWYRVRIRVTDAKIQAWIDDKEVVDLEPLGRRITVRAECLPCRPLGIATWRTTGAVRDIKVRVLTQAEIKAGK
jgi:hypothetical protein